MTTPTQNATTGKSIGELDALITAAQQAKQELYEHRLETALDQVEVICDELSLSLPALPAIAKKRRRKTRTHKDNGATEE